MKQGEEDEFCFVQGKIWWRVRDDDANGRSNGIYTEIRERKRREVGECCKIEMKGVRKRKERENE